MAVRVNKISQKDNLFVFKVVVEEKGSSTDHEVTLDKAYMEKLGHDSPEKLVSSSFEFLLSREPKESILTEFNLREISRYFPEFEEEMKGKA